LIITEGTIAQLNWKMETEGCCGIVGCWGLWAEMTLDESIGAATGSTPSVVSVAMGRDRDRQSEQLHRCEH